MNLPFPKTFYGLFCLLLTAVLFVSTDSSTQSAETPIRIVNYETLISRSDISLNRPVSRREAGMPLGNGVMGSLVWTSPRQMKFQMNRVDVYANNRNTNSFNARSSDYGFGLGFVDITFSGSGPEVFTQSDTRQHLSVYDGVLALDGKGIRTRTMALHNKDVMAIEITDQRPDASPISTVLRMLRPPTVRTKAHLAISELREDDGAIILTQSFTEDDYYCGSALAIKVLGRQSSSRLLNDKEMKLTIDPGAGTFTVLIASAASFDQHDDLAEKTLQHLKEAGATGFKALLEDNKAWWHDFWEESFVEMSSSDGKAEYSNLNYNYFMYLMASSSRGDYPPRFGGMIWKTGGDSCAWGTQHWWHNLSCYYRPMMGSGHSELMNPMLNMYSGMVDTSRVAARQIWGSKGLWIPETVWYDGHEQLPEDIAEELQDLLLLRKPWDMRSAEFRKFAANKHPHYSAWNWKGGGHYENGEWVFESLHGNPFSYLVHILTSGSKVAYYYWLRYEYTMDEDFLRNEAYPMIKGAAELFRHFPGLKMGADGKYHIHDINNHEPIRGCQDPIESIAAMRGMLPLAIKVSKMLNVDADLRPGWQDLLDNLTSYPTNKDADAIVFPQPENGRKRWTNIAERNDSLRKTIKPGDPEYWAPGRMPAEGWHWIDWGRMIPVAYYDLCTLENPDPRIREIANNSFDHAYGEITAARPMHVLSRSAAGAALLGRADDVRNMIPNQMSQSEGMFEPGSGGTEDPMIFDNRMTLKEGREAIGAERLGRASAAVQYALLQSVPSTPGEHPVIRVFPACPTDWSATFSLPARSGFMVTSSIKKGNIAFVELKSKTGNSCRIRNPWGDAKVTLYRNGTKKETLSGSLLKFGTGKGEELLLVPEGTSPDSLIEMGFEPR